MPTNKPTRRVALRTAAATAAGAAFLPQQAAPQAPTQAPAQLTNTQTGRRYRAFVRRGTTASVEELTLRAIQPAEVVVRTEASGACYTIVGGVLGNRQAQRASIPNHSGMGVVEAVGEHVKRVRVGDRVILPGTPECGQCYQCLTGRPDWCQFLNMNPQHPVADMSDGTPVFEDGHLGGLAELMVVDEVYTCPVFTEVPGEQLTMLGDTVGTGLAGARNLIDMWEGADVVVLGAGPVGLGAVQGARIAGAGQIIVVEPIAYRRELAMKLGATLTLDPNAEENLVERIRDLCKGPTERRFAGGRALEGGPLAELFAVPRGPDFTIEAVGGDAFPPKVEAGPDPTGVLPLRQAWEFTRGGGKVVMLGFGQRGDVSFPALAFANRGRAMISGQQGGLHMMRDLPRYVKLIEKGLLDVASMVTATYPLDRTREAIQAVADRTEVGAVVKMG